MAGIALSMSNYQEVANSGQGGKYELAAELIESCGNRFEGSSAVADAARLVYL